MKKIKLNKKVVENVKFTHDSQEIEVIPYISSENQEALINIYLKSYFVNDGEDNLSAGRINRMAILDLLTNISIEMEGKGLVEMLDNIVSSGLWERIEKSIKNYRSYEHNLSIAIDSKKKENSDIGHILKNFLEEKINPILQKFSDMDFSDEKLAEMKEIVGEIGKQLSSDTPVGHLISKGTV